MNVLHIDASTVNPDCEAGPNDFEAIKVLGAGNCGKTFQIMKKNGIDANKIYALKIVKSATLNYDNKNKNILSLVKVFYSLIYFNLSLISLYFI